jgi:hypothetical protein
VVVTLKNVDGVQNVYPRGTIFFEVQKAQMGYCTPKWGTAGNPGVGVACVSVLLHRHPTLDLTNLYLS